MNIINTLTLRHMKLNKQRTIVTIIGVILAVSMITAVATFVSSFIDMMRRDVIKSQGNWHVLYSDVKARYIDAVMEDENTTSAALSNNLGYAVLEGSKNDYKPYLFIKAYDEQSIKTFNLNLLEGRFPESPDEVVISSHIAENGGVTYKVGDTIHLEVGQRYRAEDGDGGIPLDQEISYSVKSEYNSGEIFKPEMTKVYTVTGIISRPEFESYWSPGYTVITYLDKNELTPESTVNISVTWKKVNKIANNHANLLAAESLGSPGVSYNRDLLRLYGILDANLLKTLYNLAGIVTCLIIIGSVTMIYNSFAISISERSRHLGMLASVGATKRQKRSSVFFESFAVGAVGIPLGIFFGTLGMGVTFSAVQPLIDSVTGTSAELKLITSVETILAAAILSAFTIFLSAYLPAIRASKISPIDAIRQSRDVKLTKRNVKTSKVTRYIFGFEAELGLKNLKRNKRRYRITIISMVVSIVLFLSVASFFQQARSSTELVMTSVPYDVAVTVTSDATDQEKREFYTAISDMEYSDEAIIYQSLIGFWKVDLDLLQPKIKEALYSGQNYEVITAGMDLKSVDPATLERYSEANGVDLDRLKDTGTPCGILFDTIALQTPDKKYAKTRHFKIETGGKLDISTPSTYNNSEETIEFEILAVADETPDGETSLEFYQNPLLIISEELFASIQARSPEGFDRSFMTLIIKSREPVKLIESIKEYQKGTSIADLRIHDVAEAERQARQTEMLISIFFYGFVALISAICIANIFNTVSTSISLRKREFAMLKSVGITPRGFGKMINYESLFYGIKALLYGLPISLVTSYLLYRAMGNSFEFNFALPWGSVIGAIIAVFVIVGLSMLYSSSKIKKENIIDVLKNENI